MKDKRGSENKPNIFDYQDHLSFLRDHVQFLKASQAGFSMRKLAQQSQLATGYLPMCLSGKRVLSSKALTKLLPHLHLKDRERKVFELLHTIGTSEDPSSRNHAINQLSRFQEFHDKSRNEVEVFRYLTKWYYVAIREMVALKDFEPDHKWIQERLHRRVSQAECQEALEFLTKQGFVTKDESGRYSISDRNLDCKEGIFKASLGEFHRQMFDLASDSIENTPRASRYILGHTFAVAEKDLAQAKEILDEALAKIEALGQQTKNPEQVYHVEMATFPLTRLPRGVEEES